jgi:hypothetical protein
MFEQLKFNVERVMGIIVCPFLGTDAPIAVQRIDQFHVVIGHGEVVAVHVLDDTCFGHRFGMTTNPR